MKFVGNDEKSVILSGVSGAFLRVCVFAMCSLLNEKELQKTL